MRKLSSIQIPISYGLLQSVGWLGFAMVTAITFWPLRYMRDQVAYRVVFVACLFLSSLALHKLCQNLWQRKCSFLFALTMCVIASYFLSVMSTAPAIWAERRIERSQESLPWNYLLAASIGGAFALIAWSALYFGFKQYRTIEDQKLALLSAESTVRLAQLEALQYQLQPHFLFNTLNAISSLVVSGQPQLATEMLANLGVLLRSSLEAPEVHTVALFQELVTIEEYLAIERARFGSRLKVLFHVDREAATAQVPRFLLQPLIENAVKYGVAARSAGGDINLRASVTGGGLRIEIENELPDRDPESKKGSGVGLRNSRQRLERLYGQYGTLSTAVNGNDRFLTVVKFPFAPAYLDLDRREEEIKS